MLALQLSPLQLEGYYVREFSFALRSGLEEEATFAMQQGLHLQRATLFNPDTMTFNIQAGGGPNPENPFRWVSMMELTTDNAPEIRFPYDFRIVLVGYFALNSPQPAEMTEDLEKAIKINSTSILYSAAREFIADVTGRGPFPAALLPSVVIGLSGEQGKEQTLPVKKAKGSHRGGVKKKTTKKGTSKKKPG